MVPHMTQSHANSALCPHDVLKARLMHLLMLQGSHLSLQRLGNSQALSSQ